MIDNVDQLYSSTRKKIGDFTFDEDVARVFPDMIQRSVPGYRSIISSIGMLASKVVTPNSSVYDLGCSLGASTFSVLDSVQHTHYKIVAVDNAPAMIKELENKLRSRNSESEVELRCEDISQTNIEHASLVILNFTLQFVPLEARPKLIQGIYAGLRPRGVLVISEKIAFPNEKMQDMQTRLHHEFKKANGYSDLEISQKRTALENVLIPETLADHQERFSEAGFSASDVWFQCFNFASMLAIK
ncbi:MAG: carboxy-S-adenosyl-L-methionine synthase CmoA [Pseudomonadota bacterium]